VPEAEREHIFEKYYRVRSGPAVLAPGTGVGLAFCKLAVSALKGRVWVEPREGKGSRFCVEIPSLSG
jgi:two-component system sensor histidine kinase VicK